jgi:hypothetical protein
MYKYKYSKNSMSHENSMNNVKKNRVIWIGITIISFLLGIFFLAHAFMSLKRHGFFGPPNGQSFHRKKINAGDIQSWMTFDFINKTFNLPPDYLKRELNINEKRYPNITIDSWAKNVHENSSMMLERIKKLIQDFQNPIALEIPASI